MRLPTSNIKMAVRKLNLRGKLWYILPHVDWKPPPVKKKAAAYQAWSLMPWNSLVIAGTEVATMVCTG